nr:SOS response-associated peptidase family protein [Chromohalobacter japonicus]
MALYSSYLKISRALRLPLESGELKPRYNVAPGTWITAVRHPSDDAPLVMDEVWWGYRPHWAKEKAPEPINATVEKVATSNYSRGAFAHYCCLMSEDGWYEWLPVDGRKQPYFLCCEDRKRLCRFGRDDASRSSGYGPVIRDIRSQSFSVDLCAERGR